MFGSGPFFANPLGPIICSECKSELVYKPENKPDKKPAEVFHDQYARDPATHLLLEDQPLECKWAGAHFQLPTMELKQVSP